MATVKTLRRPASPRQVGLRTASASFGGVAATLALTVVFAIWLPLAPADRGMLAVLLWIPLWVGAATYAYLDRSAARAGLVLIGIALAASLAAYLT